MEYKTCTKCGEHKSLDSFALSNGAKDGRHTQCKACLAAAAKKYRLENNDKTNACVAKYRAENPERVKACLAKSYIKHAEQRKEDSRKWHNANREHALSRMRKYQKANLAKFAALCMKRKAAKLKATPSWANIRAIEIVYAKAQRLRKWMNMDYHVDHMVPILSKFVCGLHCEDNLQIIPASENVSKKNLWWPDMW